MQAVAHCRRSKKCNKVVQNSCQHAPCRQTMPSTAIPETPRALKRGDSQHNSILVGQSFSICDVMQTKRRSGKWTPSNCPASLCRERSCPGSLVCGCACLPTGRERRCLQTRGCYCASLAPSFIRRFRLICQRLLHATRTVWRELCFGC